MASKDKPTLSLLKNAWVVLGGWIVLVSTVLILVWPERVAAWVSMAPFTTGIVVAMGGAAFGGPAIKRRQLSGGK